MRKRSCKTPGPVPGLKKGFCKCLFPQPHPLTTGESALSHFVFFSFSTLIYYKLELGSERPPLKKLAWLPSTLQWPPWLLRWDIPVIPSHFDTVENSRIPGSLQLMIRIHGKATPNPSFLVLWHGASFFAYTNLQLGPTWKASPDHVDFQHPGWAEPIRKEIWVAEQMP